MPSALIKDLAAWVRDAPNDIAIITSTERLTVREFADRVSRIAAMLVAKKTTPDSLVAVSAEGAWEFAGMCAVQAVGAVSVITPSESEFRESGATTLLHVGRAWAGNHTISMTTEGSKSWTEWMSDNSEDPDKVVHVCLTSGTTGASKLVEMTHDIASRRTNGYDELWPVNNAVSLFRLSAIAAFGAANGAVRMRQPYVVVHTLDEPTVSLLASPNLTEITGAPNQIVQAIMVAEKFGIPLHFDTVMTAGAPQPPQFFEAVRRICDGEIRNVYGSTECGSAAISFEVSALAFTGKPVLGSEFQVVDSNDAPVETGSEGIVRYKTPAHCVSYRVGTAREPISNPEGWFYPGDLGMILEDGSIAITGRVADVINISGVKINPLEIESDVESIEGVHDAACVPVTFPDGQTHLVLAIVVKDKAAYDAVVARISNRDIAGRPNMVVDIPMVPRNRNGKIDRVDLATKLESAIRIEPTR